MADRKTWAKRVSEWRASGLTSEQFCEDREYTAGGLRNAAHLVEGGRRRRKAPAVRLARVLRAPAASAPPPPASEEPLIVELGGARVEVRSRFDRTTLAAVLDVLASRGGGA